ncbi:MAG: DUF4907 domain-containing protein, partial [Bacteroidetes bacterium]|nr:DUF4907 domain-containing protein [Bacteroidota bacterium]
MTKKEKILLLFSIIMLGAAAGILFYKRNSGSASNDLLRIDLKTFQQAGGWGYDIRVGATFFIHQDRIPVISGNKMFVSEAEALKTGQLLVEKI